MSGSDTTNDAGYFDITTYSSNPGTVAFTLTVQYYDVDIVYTAVNVGTNGHIIVLLKMPDPYPNMSSRVGVQTADDPALCNHAGWSSSPDGSFNL